jgi:REP element-mobilizing transposase RayT
MPESVFSVIIEKVRQTIAQYGCELEAMSVAAEHVHALALLPSDYDRAKEVVGKCKTYSSLAVRSILPGTVWSRGCAIKRIEDAGHWHATQRYIVMKQEKSALIWSAKHLQQAESTARGGGSKPPT